MINNKGRQPDSSGWWPEPITDALNKRVTPTKQGIQENNLLAAYYTVL